VEGIYESKCSQSDKLNQERKGKKQEHEEYKRDSQKHLTNRIPKDMRRLGPPFPLQSFGSYTNSPICGPLSQETLRGEENLGKKEIK
jgi:hypothetical protein